MSVEPFNKLVKLAARAFYDDVPLKGENQPRTGRSDNRGMAVVILDALTRRQWVREEDLAKDLKLHSKQLRRTLRYFEEEKLVTRDHRKETAKGAQLYSKAVAATGDGHHGKDGEEKIKLHTHSYCCLDYSQIYDVVRYRMHRMRKKLKDELENRNTVQEYVCPDCGRRYTAFDALQLLSELDESFHCANCNGELVAESDKLAAEEMGDGDDNARRRRREKLKDMLQKMEGQLKPLMEQLNRVKDLTVPEFGTLQAWESRANVNRAANGDANNNDPSKSASQGFGGTPMPSIDDAKVEVALPGSGEKEEDTKHGAEAMKVLPPWMIKQGMVLTEEQRGEVRKDSTIESKSTPLELSDDKKLEGNEKEGDKSSIENEYAKAYYAALLKRQQEQEEAAKRSQQELLDMNNPANSLSEASDRQVGMKSKREEDDQDDDVEWEEAPTAGTTQTSKVHDLNAEAEESGDDDDDEIDWEEG